MSSRSHSDGVNLTALSRRVFTLVILPKDRESLARGLAELASP